MTLPVRCRPDARQDLAEIIGYIAERNPGAAGRRGMATADPPATVAISRESPPNRNKQRTFHCPATPDLAYLASPLHHLQGTNRHVRTRTDPDADGQPFDWAAFHGYTAAAAARVDGWTAAKQRLFLEALSQGHPVTHACRIVALSKQSAYELRNSARGAGFALGWNAAVLLGRNALADALMERAINGVRETVEQDDGRMVTRHRYDNRLAMAMLTRLDKQADAARGAASDAAARLVAADFEPFLDLIGRDAGPARAGLFLGARAEAAGLLVLAPPPADAHDGPGQASQVVQEAAPREPVWWSDHAGEYRTHFPPPDGFRGTERGDYGSENYSRTLTPEEEAVADAPWRAEFEARAVAETLERDAWFGFIPAPPRTLGRGRGGGRRG